MDFFLRKPKKTTIDSMKNQNALTAIFCLRPTNFKEDFRSIKFKDSPIIVEPLDGKNRSPPTVTDSINPLVLCSEEVKDVVYSLCNFCREWFDPATGYYLRQTIVSRSIVFHKECIEPMVKNPYHPKHSLQVLTYHEDISSNKRCYCCYSYKQSFRYCSICDFRICHECMQKQVLLTINHKKRHEHKLSYIFREASMTCDVCGLDDRRYFIYACHQCDFAVHKECIYFPWIVKISRHEHRLSFNSSFLVGELFCGVCREKFDENYGGYSCVKGCSYVVHSKCVVYGNVWDGKELEGEREDSYEDTTPFKNIGEGIIQHFSHNHYMRFQKDIDKADKENSRCQACTLLVYEGDIFSCMECDFVLHKVCACLPMRLQHAMHPHLLVLREGSRKPKFSCSACHRECNGFRYEGRNNFLLDMHCASVSEPLDYPYHVHPLFLPSKYGSKRICSICESKQTNCLECGECDFVLCFGCATLPNKFMYKYDEHPLIFSFEKDVRDRYWCDVCEKKINPKYGVYRCNDCDVTLHTKCLLGEEMYMLPGILVKDKTLFDMNNYIILNNHLTRHKCNLCHRRCEDKIVYKGFSDDKYCSMSCLYYMQRRIEQLQFSL